MSHLDPGPQRALFVSASAAARRDAVLAQLRALPAHGSALLLVPSPNAGLWWVAEALAPGEGRFGWERRALEGYAATLALPELARSGRAAVRGAALQALCAHAVHRLKAAGELGRFAAVSDKPGFARALTSTLRELRLGRVTPEQLAPHDPALAACLQAYLRALEDARLADEADVYTFAGEAARAVAPAALIALDVPVTHACEAALIAALCAGARSVCATVPLGDVRALEAWRAALGPDVRVAQLQPDTAHDLGRLQAQLFESELAPQAPAGDAARVQFVSSPGESREAVEVARGLLAAAESGVPFDRMAVLVRAVENYRAVLEEALVRARIPAYFADGVRRPAPEGRAFAALLSCAANGLSARRFAEYLSIGVMPRPPATGTELAAAQDVRPVSPRQWERLLVEAAVVGGRARWSRRLSGLGARWRDELQLLAADDPRRDGLTAQLHALAELERFALPLLDVLEALPQGAPFSTWLPALEQLATRALAEPSSVLALLLELAPLGDEAPLSLAELARLLAPRLNSLLIPSTGNGAGKVFVGSIDEVRGRSFECVFVVGLAEKLFPARLAEDPLLPDRVRRALSPALDSMEQRVARERLLLRLCVGAAQDKLQLTFPRFDTEQGRPRVPSFYGLELLQALFGRLPAFDELTRRAHPGAAARLGWPAPADASRAIDDAEYDLALIERLRAAETREAGAARYLLSANVHLARALRSRARRWQLQRFVPADGFVVSEGAARELLARHALSARNYSPTALAHFAICPYRFYLYAVARIEERDQVSELSELDARQRGVLFHQVLNRTVGALKQDGLLPLAREQLGEARARLRAIFQQTREEAREQYAPPIGRVFDAALSGVFLDLEGWLEHLALEADWVPEASELLIAPNKRGAAIAEGLSLSGAIDLVERHRSAAEDGRTLLRATDYKTGAVPDRLGMTSGGHVLQPLLYALALEVLSPEARVVGGRLYFCTAHGRFSSHEVPLNERTRTIASQLVAAIAELLHSGFLPAAPERDACEHCQYRAICGPYEEERVNHVKSRDFARLRPLHAVRRLA